MTGLRTYALVVMAILAITVGGTSIDAQTTSPTSQSALIAVSIGMNKSVYTVGQKPTVVLTMKNVGSQETCLSAADDRYRVHVDGASGEGPETEYNRHLHGDYRPGDGPPPVTQGSVVCGSIVPGSSDTLTFNLSIYYDLSAPGKYSVYLEVRDGAGKWLRTNTATFEIEPPAQ